MDSTGEILVDPYNDFKWKSKKEGSLLLANSYSRIGYKKKANTVKNCGRFLNFRLYENNEIRLESAQFCKNRLCPLCNWRREKKIFAQSSKIMNVIKDNYKFLFLSLTVKNCSGEDLKKHIDMLQYGFNNLTHYKEFKQNFKGYIKVLEITYNVITNTFHPHFHVILACNNSYFKSKSYLSQNRFSEMWKQCLDLDYVPVIDVRAVKGDLRRSVCEISKYSVKDNDYLYHENNLTDYLVNTLTDVLENRRLISYGGVFKTVKQRLKLDDCLDGDLIHCDNDENLELKYIIVKFQWHFGLRNYVEYV